MNDINFLYLALLVGLFITINFVYRKFPKNHDKLFKMLTENKV